jgi:hypothetical protein
MGIRSAANVRVAVADFTLEGAEGIRPHDSLPFSPYLHVIVRDQVALSLGLGPAARAIDRRSASGREGGGVSRIHSYWHRDDGENLAHFSQTRVKMRWMRIGESQFSQHCER